MLEPGSFLPGTEIEIVHPDHPHGGFRCALFDFDGTISLVRSGWQAEMIPMMVELLMLTPDHESETDLKNRVEGFIDLLTGKQTIFQMIWLAEEVNKRGGTPLDPTEYKRIFQDRLDRRINERLTDLRAGKLKLDDLMVPGARFILQLLSDRGVICYLASGTDYHRVKDDVVLLEIEKYFCEIHGAREGYWNFSKGQVIDHILEENSLDGSNMIAFGDGYADIQESKQRKALAVGLATDEVNMRGANEWKRRQLIDAGADLIVPEFRQADHLVAYLFAGSSAC